MRNKDSPLPWNSLPYDGVLPPGVHKWVFPSAIHVVTGEIEIREYKDDAGNKMQGVVVNAKEQKRC